jgi:hypothetical protein
MIHVSDHDLPADRFERALFLMNLLIDRATGNAADDGAYKLLRREFMDEPMTSDLLPRYVRTCRDLSAFWPIAKGMHPSWEGRRVQIRNDFEPLLAQLETGQRKPLDQGATDVLAAFSADGVAAIWNKALDRRSTDPEGAITAARTLLETVCKTILDEGQIIYPDDADLPKLYKLTAELLNIAPSQHTEDVFRRILGGCTSVVEGLGALRNKVGDAHGQGRRQVRPLARHAHLAVNLAGTMATFIVETWLDRRGPIAPADLDEAMRLLHFMSPPDTRHF